MKLILEIIFLVILFVFFGPLILGFLAMAIGLLISVIMTPVIYICALIDRVNTWYRRE